MIINMNGAKAPETPSSVLQEKTVIPETLPTVIGPDEGYDGLSQVTVNPDAQLKAENIRSGKTIFGVTGVFVGEPTGEFDISLVNNIGDYNAVDIPVVGEIYRDQYDIIKFRGENFQLDNTVQASGGTGNKPSGGVTFDYGGKRVGVLKQYTPSVNTYVPSGYYWVHIQRTIPEGDYSGDARYIVDRDWSGRIHYKGAYLFLAAGNNTKEQIGSPGLQEVYGQAVKIELGDITVNVVKGMAQVHIPQVELDLWLGTYSASYAYWTVVLGLSGNYVTEAAQ